MRHYVSEETTVWVGIDNPELLEPYLTEGHGYYYDGDNLQMSLHPDWIKEMDKLEVGDPVTTHDGRVGIISRVTEQTGLGFKVFDVLIEGREEKYFSINLKKIEVKK